MIPIYRVGGGGILGTSFSYVGVESLALSGFFQYYVFGIINLAGIFWGLYLKESSIFQILPEHRLRRIGASIDDRH
jgi:hypothetical protein